MQFSQGARVMTLDGKVAGHVDRVVIDAKTNEITHLVVRHGLLQRQDKVGPITIVTLGRDGQLSVHVRSDDLELLPDYEEEQYILTDKAGEGHTPPAALLYPPYPGGGPGIANYGPPYVTKTHLGIPGDIVALKEGAKVISRDKIEVGHVTQVVMNTSTDQVTHFVIAKGFLVKENRLIPVGWVDRLADNAVHLAIDSNTVERLPVVEPI